MTKQLCQSKHPSRQNKYNNDIHNSKDDDVTKKSSSSLFSSPLQASLNLERIGRYLLSLPRDDVRRLMKHETTASSATHNNNNNNNSNHYLQFVNAFERLAEAHRAVVNLAEQEEWGYDDDDDPGHNDQHDGDDNGCDSGLVNSDVGGESRCDQKNLYDDMKQPKECTGHVGRNAKDVKEYRSCNNNYGEANSGNGDKNEKIGRVSRPSSTNGNKKCNDNEYIGDYSPTTTNQNQTKKKKIQITQKETTQNNQNQKQSNHQKPELGRNLSFLQHRLAAGNFDDVVLRALEYLECTSLVQCSVTCLGLRSLCLRSATIRTVGFSKRRMLIGSNNYGCTFDDFTYSRNHGVIATGGDANDGAGDNAETCVPFLSIFPSQSSSSSQLSHSLLASGVSVMKVLRASEHVAGILPSLRPHVRVPFLGLEQRVTVSDAGDEEYNGIYHCTESDANGFVFTKPRPKGDGYDDDGNNRRIGVPVREDNRDEDYGGVLRCIIAKRFSNDVSANRVFCFFHIF